MVNSYELAWRMQQNAPGVLDLSKESPETLELYGIGEKATDNFGRQCLMARRLCEAGVRYVQVTYGDNTANPAWDQHSNLPKHADHARAVDKPIAGLLADLKQRGLLEDTLVWWGGEFGRTPYAEKNGTGPRPQPRRLHRLAGRRRRQARLRLRRDRRVRPPRRRGQGPHARPARDDPAPARPGPREADLSATPAAISA